MMSVNVKMFVSNLLASVEQLRLRCNGYAVQA